MRSIKIIALLLLFNGIIWAQENALQDKITLKTGEVYTGEILVLNSEIVMLKSSNGTRFQFQLSEVKKFEKTTKVDVNDSTTYYDRNSEIGNFAGFLDISGGVSSAKFGFGSSPNTQASLVFGNKSVLGQQIFLGVGIGLNNTLLSETNSNILFMPVFLKMQANLSKDKTAPFAGLDTGYAFGMTNGYGGGAFAKISTGISRKTRNKTSLSIGFFAGINSISGNLTEINSAGSYNYHGNTIMTNFGLNFGLLF